ncbi:hypothetical protein IMSAG013_00775 [Clostridiales bacterium]|nr:hypothetical protein IMSAG013_00775 [Clostridiales bacterium]
MKSTNRDMADSTFWWGVVKTYTYGAAVAETSWERVSEKKKQCVEKKLSALTQKILKKQGHIKPLLKIRLFFSVMRQMQKHGWNKADMDYWKGKGWTEKKRPWK